MAPLLKDRGQGGASTITPCERGRAVMAARSHTVAAAAAERVCTVAAGDGSADEQSVKMIIARVLGGCRERRRRGTAVPIESKLSMRRLCSRLQRPLLRSLAAVESKQRLSAYLKHI
jgi:hypothetical protein